MGLPSSSSLEEETSVERVVDLTATPSVMKTSLLQDLLTLKHFDPSKGPLDESTIKEGYTVLGQIAQNFGEENERRKEAEKAYFEVVPHSKQLGIRSKYDLNREIELLQLLERFVHTCKRRKEQHRELFHRTLSVLDPKRTADSGTCKLIRFCLESTSDPSTRLTLKLLHVYVLQRDSEDTDYRNHLGELRKKNGEPSLRKMLWHGSLQPNWPGIIENGLKIAPPEAPHNGFRYGKGLYFSNAAGKSARYCVPHELRSTPENYPLNTSHFMVLAEVSLGKAIQLNPDSSFEGPSEEVDSTFVLGRFTPTREELRDSCGWGMGPLDDRGSPSTFGQREFDEFVVYSPLQVHLRFLVEFSFVET